MKQLVEQAAKLDQEAKSTRTTLTRNVAVALKGRPSGLQVSPNELKEADEMIRNSYALMGYLSRGGRDDI